MDVIDAIEVLDSMDSLIEVLVLWAGLLLMLWMLRQGLAQVEDSLGSNPLRLSAINNMPPRHISDFETPEDATEVIGQYMGAFIYRKITIKNMDYYFERIRPSEDSAPLSSIERCVKPGIVYKKAANKN
jgi:hypothetical protein